VIYAQSFAAPATHALRQRHIQAQVPTSNFLATDDADLVTAAGVGAVVQRLRPSTAARGLHGLSLVSVTFNPGGKVLQPGSTVNHVPAQDGTTVVVAARNGGQFTEYDIPVKLTFGTGSAAYTLTSVLRRVAANATGSVVFRSIFTQQHSLDYGRPTKLSVRVSPVPGERTASNNVGSYTITPTVAP
jgi:hypothetical protein